MSIAYSRTSPSPRYRELLDQYRSMHEDGERFRQLPAAETFSGQSLLRHVQSIKELVSAHQAQTLLDYGSGKGLQYSNFVVKLPDGRRYPSIHAYWGVQSVTCYDPGYQPFDRLPAGQYDGVVCTDVLEHCPESDIEWIVDELMRFARAFVYANVACYPASKRLANGENAHCTIQTPSWWHGVWGNASTKRPSVRYVVQLDELVTGTDGVAQLRPIQLRG